MPKKAQYKNSILLSILEKVLPSNVTDWEAVCAEYQNQSGEDILRDVDSIKRHFNEKLCNKHQKVTGESSASALIARAQIIYKFLFFIYILFEPSR